MSDEPHILKPSSFRDSIPTVDEAGKRLWLYPRKPPGRRREDPRSLNLYRIRTYLSVLLLAILFFGPFVRINGNPLLMMNIVKRKFSILGFMFWPQDMHLLAISFITFMFSIVVFTAVFGRIWCGWLCPQTVLMELVFRKIEYWIEGDSREMKARNEGPWNADKLLRKSLKMGIFFALSFLIGNLLLAYIIGSDELIRIITDDPRNHVKGLTAMLAFSGLFFAIFARFREQACTFICPYGRIQSVLLDENSIVVAYDWKRGEKRQAVRRDQKPAPDTGDCVDCKLCVEVCPTGIDIRNGTQMECVNCTACIDACNSVMSKLKRAPGLIRYASENNIARGEKLRFTPRLRAYTVVLTLMVALLITTFAFRTPVEANLLRTPGTWYQERPDGTLSNVYNLRMLNKTSEPMTITLRLLDLEGGQIQIAGNTVAAAPGETSGSAVIISLPKEFVHQASRTIHVEVLNGEERCATIKTSFIGPESNPHGDS